MNPSKVLTIAVCLIAFGACCVMSIYLYGGINLLIERFQTVH